MYFAKLASVVHKFLPFLAAAVIIGLGIHSDAAETAKKKSKTVQKSTTTTKKSTTASTKKSTASKSTSTKKSGATTSISKKSGATTSSSKKKGGTSTSRRRSAKKAPARPRGQQQPTPERYQEIQQALIARGYMQGEPTGAWGPESADALKRFQQDQKIDATGKLNSLSLIALGLGPKRNATAIARPNNDNRSTEGNKGP